MRKTAIVLMSPLAFLALLALIAAILVAPFVAARHGALSSSHPARTPVVRPASRPTGAGNEPRPSPAGRPAGVPPGDLASDGASAIDPERVEARLRHSLVRSLEAAVDRDPQAVADALRRVMRESRTRRS